MNEYKKIWVLRHSHAQRKKGYLRSNKPGLSIGLSDKGRKTAKQLASYFLKKNNKPVKIFTSFFVRAYQTAMIFYKVFEINPPKIMAGLNYDYEAWSNVSLPKNPTSIDLYKANPLLAKKDACVFLNEIQKIGKHLNDNEKSICISQGGLIEVGMSLAICRRNGLRITDVNIINHIPKDFKENHGIVFFLDQKNQVRVIEEFRYV